MGYQGRDFPMKTSIAIVVHQPDMRQLYQTLQALDRAVGAAAITASLMILDNTPVYERLAPQQHQSLLERLTHIPHKEWRYLPENRGFGAAHNVALRASLAECHLILNPDLELAEDALQQGVGYLQSHPEVVLVAPRVTDEQGRQQYLCKRYPTVLALFLRAFAPQWLRDRQQPALAAYEARDLQSGDVAESGIVIASGACMLCRTQALQAVDGFDERYFLYFEDFDLSLRLRGQGLLVFLPAMQAVHHGGHAARKGWRHIRWFMVSAGRVYQRFGWRWR